MKTPNINKDPVESEVAYLFAFTLGFISDANAVKRSQANKQQVFAHDQYEGLSIAGSTNRLAMGYCPHWLHEPSQRRCATDSDSAQNAKLS